MTQETITRIECIDIGANLTSKKFRSDLDQVLSNAQQSGVNKIVLTGSSERTSCESAELAKRHSDFLFATAGIHPHDASAFDPEVTTVKLRDLYRRDEVVAVGECGLDFNRDFSPRDQQRSCFLAHLDLAAESQLPMFLHERDAFGEFHGLMKESRDRISQAVVHCFTGDENAAKAYLDLDLHLGITGWVCDQRRGQQLREAVRIIPPDRLMIETDCPYLAPRDIRPKINRNEPKYLPHVLRAVAECRGDDPAILGPQILETTRRFFGI